MKKYLLFFLFFFVLVLLVVQLQKNQGQSPLISPLASGISSVESWIKQIGPKDKRLEKGIQEALQGAKGNYSIVIKDLKTGEGYAVNAQRMYDTASLYKLWVMATAYQQIQQGKLKENEQLSEDIVVLNDTFQIASESAESTEGNITLPVNAAVKQMITISHNYAALLLSKRVGLTNVAIFLKNKGLVQSSVGVTGGEPHTTAADIALFFEKLYKGELANKEYTEKMISLLKQQQLNNKLPKELPKDAVIAHKTGELGLVTHDAGIVYTKNGDYIIVVLSESDYPPGAEERIVKISKAAYDYFVQK